jgi:hypothetical protein
LFIDGRKRKKSQYNVNAQSYNDFFNFYLFGFCFVFYYGYGRKNQIDEELNTEHILETKIKDIDLNYSIALKELEVAVLISCNDCRTCIESIISDVVRYKESLGLNRDKIGIVVIEPCWYSEFNDIIRMKYGRVFKIFKASGINVVTPLVYIPRENKFFVIRPDISELIKFSDSLDSLIMKEKK